MFNVQQNRDFHRMTLDAPAQVIYVYRGEMRKIETQCHDLSATGLSVVLPEALQEGDELEVVIPGRGDIQPLDAKVKVKRIVSAEDQYLHGCEITSLR